jgi:hypothetical protein
VGIRLPTELVSLIHHVELNKAGWWDRALQRLIVAAIWLSHKPITIQSLSGDLRSAFQLDVDTDKLNIQVEQLFAAGTLVTLPDDSLKITESARKSFLQDVSIAEASEKAVQTKFSELLKIRCQSLDAVKTWQDFDTHLLMPLVGETGANTLHLLSGSGLQVSTPRINHFLSTYPSEYRESLHAIITDFLDPKDENVRSYILRSLNAHFLVEAATLREDTLRAVTQLADLRPVYNVFVDTNFLFSILSLHANPSNEAATTLQQLIKRLPETIKFKLYVLPPTLEEAKNRLILTKIKIADIPGYSNLTQAALNAHISGIATKFFEERAKSPTFLSSADYFDPYIRDLTTIMRAAGVELFNENMDGYSMKQDVIDDVVEQVDFEEKNRDRPKSYEAIKHDMILWHFTRDKRPVNVESPIEAKYWIVTIDYRFLAFDGYKRRSINANVPVCLHPTNLIQMLQFWIPRSPEFEEAMLSSMRLPFLFEDFDSVSEKTTLRILDTLGRYEGIADLSTEIVAAITLNEALREKMRVQPSVEKDVKLIRDALIQHLSAEKAKTEEFMKESEAKGEKIEQLNGQLQVFGEKIKALEGTLASRDNNEKQRQSRLLFSLLWISVVVCVLLFLGLPLSYAISNLLNWTFGKVSIPLCGVLFILVLLGADSHGSCLEFVKNWKVFCLLHRFRVWFSAAICGGVIVKMLVEYILRK